MLARKLPPLQVSKIKIYKTPTAEESPKIIGLLS